MIAQGSIRKFGDGVDTDVIIPARYLSSRDRGYLGKHCMEAIDPDFVNRVKQGDIMVAGQNFGCGSSREHAVLALQGAGISCVVAASFSRIFFRNAINRGLAIVVCPEAAKVAEEGKSVRVDTDNGCIEISGQRFPIIPWPNFLGSIIAQGGVVPYVRARLAAERANTPASIHEH